MHKIRIEIICNILIERKRKYKMKLKFFDENKDVVTLYVLAAAVRLL